MSFSKETRNCVGNKMKVTAGRVPGREERTLPQRPADVSSFANFVIKSNKKIETGRSDGKGEGGEEPNSQNRYDMERKCPCPSV